MPNCDAKQRGSVTEEQAKKIRLKMLKEFPNCASQRLQEIITDELRDELNEEIIRKAKKERMKREWKLERYPKKKNSVKSK